MLANEHLFFILFQRSTVLHGHSGFFIPTTTANDLPISIPFYNVFGMTWSLTGDWTRDLPHLKQALFH